MRKNNYVYQLNQLNENEQYLLEIREELRECYGDFTDDLDLALAQAFEAVNEEIESLVADLRRSGYLCKYNRNLHTWQIVGVRRGGSAC